MVSGAFRPSRDPIYISVGPSSRAGARSLADVWTAWAERNRRREGRLKRRSREVRPGGDRLPVQGTSHHNEAHEPFHKISRRHRPAPVANLLGRAGQPRRQAGAGRPCGDRQGAAPWSRESGRRGSSAARVGDRAYFGRRPRSRRVRLLPPPRCQGRSRRRHRPERPRLAFMGEGTVQDSAQHQG